MIPVLRKNREKVREFKGVISAFSRDITEKSLPKDTSFDRSFINKAISFVESSPKDLYKLENILKEVFLCNGEFQKVFHQQYLVIYVLISLISS